MDHKVNQVLDIILGQWTLKILWILNEHETVRFNELKRKLGTVTPKMLTKRLRTLEQQQVIIRTVTPAKIPEVSYQISLKGYKLTPILDSLYQVSQQWE
jgi:DNA-binding HxlR family transcriptional regulator